MDQMLLSGGGGGGGGGGGEGAVTVVFIDANLIKSLYHLQFIRKLKMGTATVRQIS